MRTNSQDHTYSQRKPRQKDRTTSPEAQVASWLKKNTMHCQRLQARITPAACKAYAKANPEVCYGCHNNKSGKAIGTVGVYCATPGCGRYAKKAGLCWTCSQRKAPSTQRPEPSI